VWVHSGTGWVRSNSGVYPEWFRSGSEWVRSVLEWIRAVPECIHSGLTFLIVILSGSGARTEELLTFFQQPWKFAA